MLRDLLTTKLLFITLQCDYRGWVRRKCSVNKGARGFLEMTENISVIVLQLAPIRPGVQHPATILYNEGLAFLISIKLPARLTCCYSTLIPRSFGHGKRLLSP
jgi:hypothetical protein